MLAPACLPIEPRLSCALRAESMIPYKSELEQSHRHSIGATRRPQSAIFRCDWSTTEGTSYFIGQWLVPESTMFFGIQPDGVIPVVSLRVSAWRYVFIFFSTVVHRLLYRDAEGRKILAALPVEARALKRRLGCQHCQRRTVSCAGRGKMTRRASAQVLVKTDASDSLERIHGYAYRSQQVGEL